jgi:hypothetical protein
MTSYPRTLPPTIFCTIGFAKMGRIKLRLLSVEMGTSVWVYVSVVA